MNRTEQALSRIAFALELHVKSLYAEEKRKDLTVCAKCKSRLLSKKAKQCPACGLSTNKEAHPVT